VWPGAVGGVEKWFDFGDGGERRRQEVLDLGEEVVVEKGQDWALMLIFDQHHSPDSRKTEGTTEGAGQYGSS
jgi:hypothetical protein